MLYSVIKAIHIIFMVSYFAGIFYLVRLFVYYKVTDEFEVGKKEILREQYVFMARRLWNIITVPAGVIMLVTGLSLIYLNFGLMKTPWFHLKLTFLIGLAFYHYWCWKKVLQMKNLKGDILVTTQHVEIYSGNGKVFSCGDNPPMQSLEWNKSSSMVPGNGCRIIRIK